MTIEELISYVSTYNLEEVEKVRRAYEFARDLHSGQVRESGEPYITHPLSVAYILAEMHADGDTLCAALLHDTLEDTKATKEDIRELFNEDVANLVDGVTKLAKMDFATKEEQRDANVKKLVTGFLTDARIVIIKLADRLHNMRTLQYKTPKKQRENAIETLELFVPFSYYIGAYEIKNELEDTALKYINPDKYFEIAETKKRIETDTEGILKEMLGKIHDALENNNIPNEIISRIKNIYGIYKHTMEGKRISSIHDLLALKIMVDEEIKCYDSLYYIHKIYKPFNNKFKDYISNSKTNKYQSLHTTVFGPGGLLVQTQIRTHEMQRVASHGLTTYWDINKGDARLKMQRDLQEQYPFYKPLANMIASCGDNKELVQELKEETLAPKIYVYGIQGDKIELPVGSNLIDCAYRISTSTGNTMVAAKVNDEYVQLERELKDNDRVVIITDPSAYGYKGNLLEKAHTRYAKRKILEFVKREE